MTTRPEAKKETLRLYRATVNLPGARCGQVVKVDPSDVLVRPFVKHRYLVPVERGADVGAVVTLGA